MILILLVLGAYSAWGRLGVGCSFSTWSLRKFNDYILAHSAHGLCASLMITFWLKASFSQNSFVE